MIVIISRQTNVPFIKKYGNLEIMGCQNEWLLSKVYQTKHVIMVIMSIMIIMVIVSNLGIHWLAKNSTMSSIDLKTNYQSWAKCWWNGANDHFTSFSFSTPNPSEWIDKDKTLNSNLDTPGALHKIIIN